MFKIADGIRSELSGSDGAEGAIDTGSELLDDMVTDATLLVVVVASLVLYRSASVIPVTIYEAQVAVMAAVVVVLSTTILLTMVRSILLADATIDVIDIDLLEESSETSDVDIVTLQNELH